MEPIPSRASSPSYKCTKKDRKRLSENPHSDAFPAIVLLETDKRGRFSWRFSLSVPNFDHSVLHLYLCMTKGGHGGKSVDTVLLSVDIPDTEIVGISHSHLNAGHITHIYQRCGQKTEATLGAKNLEVEVKQVFLRRRLGRYDIQLSAPVKALVKRIKEQVLCVKKTGQTSFTIRLLLPIPKVEKSRPIETWIALLLDAHSRNKQIGGPFKPYKPQSRDLSRSSLRPRIASIKATPRFWSKGQQIVYLRYGIATDWERKSGRDEAVRLSMSPNSVAIPSKFHDTSGDPTEYILVVKPANLDPDSRRRLPRLRSKVRIQAAVEVPRGIILYDEYDCRSSASFMVVDLDLSDCGRDLRNGYSSAASAVAGRDTSPSRGGLHQIIDQKDHKPGKAAKTIRIELGVQDGLQRLFDMISELLVGYGGVSIQYRTKCVDFMMRSIADEHQNVVRELFDQLLKATKPPKTGFKTWHCHRAWCLTETFIEDLLEWDEYPKYNPCHDSDMQDTLRADWHQEQLRRQRAMIKRICQEWKRQEHGKVPSPTKSGSSPCRSSVTVGDSDGFHHKTANSSHQTRVPELTLEGLIAKQLRQPVEKLNKRDAELKSGIMQCMEKEDYFMLCADDIYWLAHEIVFSTQVVVGTPAAISASSIFHRLFRADICVHEDAGSSSEVDTLCLIAEQDPLACFLVGDPDQQEPAFFSKRVSGDARFKAVQESNPFASQLQTSLLQRMVASCMVPHDEYLCTDHRSNGLVSDVVSKVFYGNRITAVRKNSAPSPTQTLFRDMVTQKYSQDLFGFAIMIDLKDSKEIGSAEGYYNPRHIDEGCRLLQAILKPLREQFLQDHTGSTRLFSAGGVVTPYNSSVTEWEKAIEDAGILHVEAHTPDTMPETDFVMVDLVRSDDSGNTGDRSLLISTLSRAKSCMVVLVNTNTLHKTYSPWLSRVVNYFKDKKRFVEVGNPDFNQGV